MLDVSRFMTDGVGLKQPIYATQTGSSTPSIPSARVSTYTIALSKDPISISLFSAVINGINLVVNVKTNTVYGTYDAGSNLYNISAKITYIYTLSTKTIAITVDLNDWFGGNYNVNWVSIG